MSSLRTNIRLLEVALTAKPIRISAYHELAPKIKEKRFLQVFTELSKAFPSLSPTQRVLGVFG